MCREIEDANRIMEEQGIHWRISHEPADEAGRDIFVRNQFGQIIWRGFLVDAAIQWIIQQPVPEEDLEPVRGYVDEIYELNLLFLGTLSH